MTYILIRRAVIKIVIAKTAATFKLFGAIRRRFDHARCIHMVVAHYGGRIGIAIERSRGEIVRKCGGTTKVSRRAIQLMLMIVLHVLHAARVVIVLVEFV